MPARRDRTGERRLMNCGEYATIIRYGNAQDIDVQFDSGEINCNKPYSSFIEGEIAKPRIDRVGERRLMNCGEYATIIRYGSYDDIDVKFDSGEIVYNRSCLNFRRGCIAKKSKMILGVNRLGERRLMNCGEYATVIRYGKYSDIDVQFDSGEIVYNRNYSCFIKGSISKPILTDRVGERRLMRCGEYATIIRYGNSQDIDVKFDSGEIICNKNYGNFTKGSIAKSSSRLGERHLMHCGIHATIIRYENSGDIDVKFESGDTIKSYNYASFVKGFCNPLWYNSRTMRMCYYDRVQNDVLILMRDGRVITKSELLGGTTDCEPK